MFCQKCGKEIADTSQFCPNCGTAVNTAPPAAKASVSASQLLEKAKTFFLAHKVPCLSAIVALLVLIVLFTPVGKQMLMSKEERYLLKAAKEIKKELLAPDSINILQAGLYFYSDEVEEQDKMKHSDGSETIGEGAIYISAMNKAGGYTDCWYSVHVWDNGDVSVAKDGEKIISTGDPSLDAVMQLYTANDFKNVKKQIGTLEAWVDCEKLNALI